MKKNILFLLLTAFIMLCLPVFAVRWGFENSSMAFLLILFFAVNPIYSLVVGISAGSNMKKRWWKPILPAFFFLLGVWLFFSARETAFLLYALTYLALGVLSMGITAMIKKK